MIIFLIGLMAMFLIGLMAILKQGTLKYNGWNWCFWHSVLGRNSVLMAYC
jgi:hypothetical protein